MSKYHINPSTGMPGRCKAKPGNCPYGGIESHYNTYSEAFEKSQDDLNDLYKLLPKNLNKEDWETKRALSIEEKDQEVLDENIKKIKDDENVWLKRQEIIESDDPELILGIIDGSLDSTRKWSLIGAALKNEFLPREIINEAIYDKLDSHHELYIRHLMLNPKLTSKDLHHILENSNDDETKLLAYIHPNLDKQTIMWHIENKPEQIITFPYHGMLENATHGDDPEIMSWRFNLIREGISPFFPSNSRIYNKYNQ